MIIYEINTEIKKMKFPPIKILQLICISSIILSCKGQVKSKNELSETKTIEFGKKVSKLDNQIWHILQDQQGNYWFGSNNKGVFYFNGSILKQITTEDGLVDNTIRGLQKDKKGNVYIETPAGISKYDGTKLTTLKVKEPFTNNWKLDPNDLWFNCNGNHLYRYDGEWLHELQLPEVDLSANGMNEEGVSFSGMNSSPYAVYGIDKDKDGNMWFGTVTAGAYRYDGKSFIWFGEKELSRLPDGRVPGVRSIIQDKNGFFWLSNFYFKYKINTSLPKGYERVKAVDLPEEIVEDKILYFNSGLADQDGNLWMTTYGGGVWKYDGKAISNQEVNNGTEAVLLISIYQDNNGALWLGTNNDGVYFQNGDRFEKYVPKNIKP